MMDFFLNVTAHLRISTCRLFYHFLFALLFLFLLTLPCLATGMDRDAVVSVPAPEADTPPILSPEERAWLHNHPNIQLGYTDAFEPEVIVNADGSYSGILVDVLEVLNTRLGTDFKIVVRPVQDLIKQVAAKELAGVLAIHPSFADQMGWLKTRGFFTSYPTVFSKKGYPFSSPMDLAGKKIALIDKLFFSKSLIDSHGQGASLIKVKDAREGMARVANGDADIFFGTSINSFLLPKFQFFDLAAIYHFYAHPIHSGMAVRSDWPELVSILNKGLSTISLEHIEEIYRRWQVVPKQKITFTPKEEDWLAHNHQVKVHVADNPPFLIPGDGEPKGIAIDYLNKVARATGISIQWLYEPASMGVARDEMRTGKELDVLPAIMKSDRWDPFFSFSKPYLSSPVVIFTRNDYGFLSGIDELSGTLVSVQYNTPLTDFLLKKHSDIHLRQFATAELAMLALARGEVEAFIGSLAVGTYIILKSQITNLKVAAPSPMPSRDLSIGTRKDLPELASIIEKVLTAIPADERMAIQGKYLSLRYEHGITPGEVLKKALVVIGCAMMVVLLFMGWNRQLAKRVKEHTSELQNTVLVLATEVQDRRKAEVSLAAKVEEERALINAVNNAFFLMQSDGTIILANQALADQFDTDPGQLVGGNVFELTAETLSFNRRQHVVQAIASREVYVFSDEASGHFYEHRLYPIENATGGVDKLAVFTTDVTQKVEAQRQLEQSENRFRATFEQAAVGIAHLLPTGQFLRINKPLCSMLGYSQQELLQTTFHAIAPPDDQVVDAELLTGLLSGELDITTRERMYLRKDGSPLWGLETVTPVQVQEGQPQWLVAVVNDISDRKQVQMALQQMREYTDHLIENANVMIISLDVEGRVMHFNAAAEVITGYAFSEVKGKNWIELLVPDQTHIEVIGEFDRLLQGDVPRLYENPILTKSGEERFISWSNCTIKRGEAVVGLTSFGIDITERKQSEEQVQQYQQRLKALASQLTVVEEAERRRIATGLHDHIGQILAFARIQLAKAKNQLSGEKQTALLDTISQSLLQVIKDTKAFIFDLSSPLLNEIGLDAAITEWLENQIKAVYGLEYSCTLEGLEVELSELERTILYRNFKELVINVVKHARASAIHVLMGSDGEHIFLVVTDDGIGFNHKLDEVTTSGDGGIGLFSIQERMADIGGSLSIVSNAGQGSIATLTLPVS